MLLCERKNEGCVVKLHLTDKGKLLVQLFDEEKDEQHDLRPKDGKEAMEMFYHPFAYAA